MDRSTQRRLAVATGCLLLAVLSNAVALEAQTPTAGGQVSPSLVTSGQADGKVTPDRVSVLVNVQTRAATASAAAAENARRTRAVLDALGRLGLAKDQLSTEGYTAYPEISYDRPANTPRVVGYVVTNSVRAESKRVDEAGTIIDAALGAGANMINALTFYASSIEEARRQAIGSAVANARADAEAMARAAGGRLGGLIEMSTQGPTVSPRPMFDLAARSKAAMAEPTPINPGQQTVTVFVTARWTFIPKD